MSKNRERVVGVIPARWASTRLPGKALVPICGKPLIQWVLERTRQARLLDEVIVATDDDRIRVAVEALGGVAVMTRPDHPSGTDRVAEAVAGREAGVVINIQGDEPLIDPGLINRLAESMVGDMRWDMATAATPIRDEAELRKASVVKVVCSAEGQALYFSRSVIPFVRDERPEGLEHWRHVGVYAYRRTFLGRLVATPPCALEQAEKLEQLRALHLGARMKVLVTRELGLGVDTPEDVPLAEAALRRAGLA
jgi:3-deoxy-manno-octulosonate cytidylyltransferase (CMP-KDO synthetase)